MSKQTEAPKSPKEQPAPKSPISPEAPPPSPQLNPMLDGEAPPPFELPPVAGTQVGSTVSNNTHVRRFSSSCNQKGGR